MHLPPVPTPRWSSWLATCFPHSTQSTGHWPLWLLPEWYSRFTSNPSPGKGMPKPLYLWTLLYLCRPGSTSRRMMGAERTGTVRGSTFSFCGMLELTTEVAHRWRSFTLEASSLTSLWHRGPPFLLHRTETRKEAYFHLKIQWTFLHSECNVGDSVSAERKVGSTFFLYFFFCAAYPFVCYKRRHFCAKKTTVLFCPSEKQSFL